MNIFANLTDDQIRALSVLLAAANYELMPCPETDPEIYEHIDFVELEVETEFNKRFVENA